MHLSNENDKNKNLHEILYLIDINRYEAALNKLQHVMEYHPNDYYLLYLSALCYSQLDQHDKAIDLCKESLTLNPNSEASHFLLGSIYYDLEDYEKAEKSYLAVLTQNPLRADVMATYGYLMLKTGVEKKADKLMKEALRLEPEHEIVAHYHFLYLLAKNKKIENQEALLQYIKVADSEIKKLVHIGLAEYYNKDYKSAKENFRQAYLLDPTNKQLLSLLDDLTRISHFLFLPNRMIEKFGGPAVMWISFIVIIFVLSKLGFETISGMVALFYIFLAIYGWVAPVFYKLFFKRG